MNWKDQFRSKWDTDPAHGMPTVDPDGLGEPLGGRCDWLQVRREAEASAAARMRELMSWVPTRSALADYQPGSALRLVYDRDGAER